MSLRKQREKKERKLFSSALTNRRKKEHEECTTNMMAATKELSVCDKINPVTFKIPFGRKELFIIATSGVCKVSKLVYTQNNCDTQAYELNKSLIFYPDDIPLLLKSICGAFKFMINKETQFEQRISGIQKNTAIYIHGNSTPQRVTYISKKYINPTQKEELPLISECITFEKVTEIQEFAEGLLSTVFFVYGFSYNMIDMSIKFIDLIGKAENGFLILKDWKCLPLKDGVKSDMLRKICGDQANYFHWNVTTFLPLYQSYLCVQNDINQIMGK